MLKCNIQDKTKFITSLKQEVSQRNLEERINDPKIQQRIKTIHEEMLNSICAESPNAFWERKKHVVNLPYEPGFDETLIPTKARPIAMGPRHLEICKQEIAELERKGLIRKSKSPWSCILRRKCSRVGTRSASTGYQLQTFKQGSKMDEISSA